MKTTQQLLKQGARVTAKEISGMGDGQLRQLIDKYEAVTCINAFTDGALIALFKERIKRLKEKNR